MNGLPPVSVFVDGKRGNATQAQIEDPTLKSPKFSGFPRDFGYCLDAFCCLHVADLEALEPKLCFARDLIIARLSGLAHAVPIALDRARKCKAVRYIMPFTELLPNRSE